MPMVRRACSRRSHVQNHKRQPSHVRRHDLQTSYVVLMSTLPRILRAAIAHNIVASICINLDYWRLGPIFLARGTAGSKAHIAVSRATRASNFEPAMRDKNTRGMAACCRRGRRRGCCRRGSEDPPRVKPVGLSKVNSGERPPGGGALVTL